MAETNSRDDRTPRFVGSVEKLQALVIWIDEFTLAATVPWGNSGGRASHKGGLRELSIVLSTGDKYLGCLNPVDAEECLRLIRRLQKEVTTLLPVDGLADLFDSSDERARANEQCLSILERAVPHFGRLGVRIRGEIKSVGRTAPASSEGGKAEPSIPPAGEKPKEPPVASDNGQGEESAAYARLLSVFTNNLANERITQAASVLQNDNLTADEKLTKIDGLVQFPPTASAEKLGNMLGVTKQAVLKTDWWNQNRKGEKDKLIGRRHEKHQERAEQGDLGRPTDEDE